MERFLEVHDTVINTKDIRRVEFISDDIYLFRVITYSKW